MKLKWFLPGIALLCLLLAGGVEPALAVPPAAPAAMPLEMNYHDTFETNLFLHQLEVHSDYVTLETIGRAQSMPILALRVSADSVESVGDNPQKNAILFECGMHAREWLTTESCLLLAEYLVDHRTDATTPVPTLLSTTDVWIVALTNPTGRWVDDGWGGDPTLFYNTPPMDNGWRGNDDTSLCDTGVDLARNFSTGFNAVDAHVFCDRYYRGPAPFSTFEASALREFVENHTISMAVLLHSTSQEITNMWWTDDDAGVRMRDEARRIWREGWADPIDQANYELEARRFGTTSGQFSAWLAFPSENSGDEVDDISGPWALDGDQPLAGDFDRDGRADDVAIYRPSTYMWLYDYGHTGDTDATVGPWLSNPSQVPFAGDFDRDGFSDDVAVFRTLTGTWYYDYDHNGTTNETRSVCGSSCFRPVSIDYDGDGFVDDRIAFCSSDRRWYVDIDHDCVGDGITPIGPWGLAGDLPFAGDFDQDGAVDDVGVFRPSNRMWYYDLDHDGNTDHASGPWGLSNGLPFAGDFNGNSQDYVEDVGIFLEGSRLWMYDFFHNALIPQTDEGTLRAVQTFLIELPFKSSVYVPPYRQFVTDSSNGWHPSGNAIWDVIDDNFIPMALHLIRQSRAPGCPTKEDGTYDSAYCPAVDFGLVGAKFVPTAASDNAIGALESSPAHWNYWTDVSPAWEQLTPGNYRLVFRFQNFGAATDNVTARAITKFVHCPTSVDCWEILTNTPVFEFNVPPRAARTRTIAVDLSELTGAGEWYEVNLSLSASGDSFAANDQKVFKFRTFMKYFLPLVSHD
ncbi:MAG: M14 family zinc carboxypeptidase [Chloroflexota bacterium]